ncbi:MAG: carboxypeptidase-like regulatory domain-containing protein, partial [Pyrinomonadaceae bacterium]|nr:carboxypeptidase-like regulatory domain-containing protein [Pyrinomonadaceae bacterium]
MLSANNASSQNYDGHFLLRSAFTLFCLLGIFAAANPNAVRAQGPNDGSFVGTVADSVTNAWIPDAKVEFINRRNNVVNYAKSDKNGRFQRGSLPPALYLIRVTAPNYQVREIEQTIVATKSNDVREIPIKLVKIPVAVVENNPNPSPDPNPQPAPVPSPTSTTATVTGSQDDNQSGSDSTENLSLNPRRDQAFDAARVSTLPLGGTTLTRTFDELSLLAPGVAPPPQAIGNSIGPGIGGGVGTSGQFSVNGLRSRANNFTVDGSDNNDEDIGVRRQGFFTLVPQPVESIQEYQIITLLAPAEFGRNLGAQVNAISKSGGNRFSGTLFGFFNSDQFNSRNFFDNAGGDTTTGLTGRNFNGTTIPVLLGEPSQSPPQIRVFNDAGEKDSSTLLQGGFAVGGKIIRNKMFFFASGEGQNLNAVQERHFAVPTVEQRGLFGLGVDGLAQCIGFNPRIVNGVCLTGFGNGVATNFSRGFPTSEGGNAVFSLFPFANDPTGVYGRNTYTQALSADARGRLFSGKIDYNFPLFNQQTQTFTARYNYTDDRRDLTDVGGALFSSIRPKVRTDN